MKYEFEIGKLVGGTHDVTMRTQREPWKSGAVEHRSLRERINKKEIKMNQL